VQVDRSWERPGLGGLYQDCNGLASSRSIQMSFIQRVVLLEYFIRSIVFNKNINNYNCLFYFNDLVQNYV